MTFELKAKVTPIESGGGSAAIDSMFVLANIVRRGSVVYLCLLISAKSMSSLVFTIMLMMKRESDVNVNCIPVSCDWQCT